MRLTALFLSLVATQCAQAEVRLAAIFTDHMVLQRDQPVAIWGRADAGEAVEVRFGPHTQSTRADGAGTWKLSLPPMNASAVGRPLVVQGQQTLELQDVLVGDVWICSGQSNMQMGLERTEDGPAVVAQADHPTIRLFRVENRIGEPDVGGQWLVCSPESVARFSGLGYYFGTTLQRELDVPIGLVGVSWGATGIESWTPVEALGEEPASRIAAREEARRRHDQATAAGQSPRLPQSLRPENGWGACFESLIRPLAGLSVRGVIWYQGEGNLGSGRRYEAMLERLIRAWRDGWQGDLPFGVVQLPNNRPPSDVPGESNWAAVRESQRRVAQRLDRVGLITTIDVGDANDGHPKNKRDVGARLAHWALTELHGLPRAYRGPVLRKVTREPGRIVLQFDHAGESLETRDGEALQGFARVDAKNLSEWIDARIESPDRVILATDASAIVRYAWADNPVRANLTDATGLPASPFEVGP